MNAKLPIADAHCDFLYGMYQLGYDIREPLRKQTICLPYMREGGVKLQFFAAWADKVLKTPFLQQNLSMIDAYHDMIEANSDILVPLTSNFTPNTEKIATVLTVEGGEAIEDGLAVLRIFKRLGVSALSLTWNHNNALADAAVKRGAKGLTAFGKEAVLEMERINMALDVAHLSDKGIDDALNLLKSPIFASHSNARALCGVQRCIKDEHIQEISKRGGVVGVNFYYKQLTDASEASIKDIVKHILHIIKVGGINCCTIGSDFDGMTQYPVDMPDCSHFQQLVRALRNEGLSNDDILNVCYSNLFSYIIQFV